MVSRIVKINGHVSLLPAGSAGSDLLIKPGNFKGYHPAGSPYAGWLGMFGVWTPNNESMVFTSDMQVHTNAFPNNTKFNWNITPDPDWSGINGYLHVSYGNYDDSAGSITPRQVKNITDLTATADWTYTGDSSSGLLCELWLSPSSAASGSVAKTYEIGFMPRLSTEVSAWVATLPVVGSGSFTDKNGIVWNVRHTGDAQDYFVAYRPGYVDFVGALPFRDYFNFLSAAGKITGNEWVNGLAFGVEPRHGTASLTINQFTVAYS